MKPDKNKENESLALIPILDHSWQTQKADLRLRDLSDIWGILKFEYFYPKTRIVESPYIYKFSKEDESFIIIGTCHALPLDVYPQPIQDLLFKCQTLVVESTGSNDSEQTDDLIIYKEIDTLEWFEDLPILHQQVIDYIISENSLEFNIIPVDVCKVIAQSTPWQIIAWIETTRVDKIDDIFVSMDTTIFREFFDSGKTILSLESFEQNQSDIFSMPFDQLNQEFIEDYKSLILEKELIGSTEDIKLLQNYLSNNISLEINDFVKTRNANWLKKIPELLKEHKTDMLFAVGLNHLWGEGGLLTILNSEDWVIEQCDLVGNFNLIESLP